MLSRQSPWTDSIGMYGAIATGAVLAVTAIIAVGGFMRRPDQTCVHKPTLQQELDSSDSNSHVITTGTGTSKQQQQQPKMEWGMPSSTTNTVPSDVHTSSTSTKSRASVQSSKQSATAAAAARKASKKDSSALSSAEKLRGGDSHIANSGTTASSSKARAKPVTISDTGSDDLDINDDYVPHQQQQQQQGRHRAQQQQQQQQQPKTKVYNTRLRDRQQD
jgi:hypothetical protein